MTVNGSPATSASADVHFDATLCQYKIVVDVYVVGTLCVVGIAGNALSIAVLGRDQTNRRTTGFMLQMLAVADAVYLVGCLFIQTLNCAVKWTDWLPEAVRRGWPYVEVYSWPTTSVAQTATVWLVVVLTADRYIAICRPLHAAQYSTLSRLRRAVAVVWLLAVAYNLPGFFEQRVVEVKTAVIRRSVVVNGSSVVSTNLTKAMANMLMTWVNRSTRSETVLRVRNTAMRSSLVYFLSYKTCLYLVFRFLLPFAALAFFNQRLVRAMRESDRLRRRSATRSGGTERQHTWTLVVVVVVFVVCELPTVAVRVWVVLAEYAGDYIRFSITVLRYANMASNLMLTVNSSVNVVIYCFMGRQFRAILLRVVGCGMRRNPTDAERPAVPLQPTPILQPSGDPRPQTSHRSADDNAVCRVNVAVDVHETRRHSTSNDVDSHTSQTLHDK